MISDRRQTTLTILAALFLLGAGVRAQEDGWLSGKGGFNIALTFAYEEFDRFWVGDNKVSDPGVRTVSRKSWNLWMAYGVTDDIDLSLNASYVDADSSGPLDGTSDFQDLILSAKIRVAEWKLGPGHLSFLLGPGVKIPMGNYEDDFLTAIGDNQVDLRARVIGQYALDCGPYLAVETGYDFRLESPSDEFPLHVKVGGSLFNVIGLSAFYSRVDSLGGYDIGEGPFPGLEEDYERLGASIAWFATDNLSVIGSVWTTLDGKNTGDLDGFSVGLALSF
jgi:hypothetical protein